MSELTIDRPIDGDITGGNRASVPQEGPAEFLAAFDNLIQQDGVVSVHWQQYTPYFNDGEPCEFSVGEMYVRLGEPFFEADEDDEDEYGDWEDDYIEDRPGIFSEYDLRQTNYDAPGRPNRYTDREGYDKWLEDNSEFDVNGQDTRAIYKALNNLNSPRFESVMLANFGDHAEVTGTKEGFKVSYYEHD